MELTQNMNDRTAALDERRVEKMARSSHAFVRGSTVQHYEWLAAMPSLPAGPPVWICGDCHVGNLGPIADKDGRVAIQIRDLDQATIGNPAHDLVRLALSLASVARSSDLPGITTTHIVEQVIAGYAAALLSIDQNEVADEPAAVRTVRRESLGRKWHHLADERLGDITPMIPLGKKFWELAAEEKWDLGLLLDSPAVKSLILTFASRDADTKVELVDAAYWMKGCSSLGMLRYAALVHVGGKRRHGYSLIDVTAAGTAAAPSGPGSAVPADHAERVVAAARALSPNLGDRMAAGAMREHPVFIRELMPEDLKLEMEQFSRTEAVTAARYLAGVVGKAHGRQMNADDRRAWAKEVGAPRVEVPASPSWLWSSLVELMVRHEGAYLEHCRVHGRTA